MKDLIAKEIIGLHQFFEKWYSAKVDNTSAEFDRLDSVFHSNFELIAPSGVKISKSKLLELIKGEYGKFQDSDNFSIVIEDIDFRFIGKDMSLATYKEIGNSDSGPKNSLITAIFRRNLDLINGVEWLHIHET